AVDGTLENLYQVKIPDAATTSIDLIQSIPDRAPEFVRNVTAEIIAGRGDMLPVSALPIDGTYPVGTTKWEKRNLALEVPVWAEDICIQCGKCVLVCPHAVIRSKVYDAKHLAEAPTSFKSSLARFREFSDQKYTLQVSGDDCTGCRLCVEICPVKDKSQVGRKAINMSPYPPIREVENTNWGYFLKIPEVSRIDTLKFDSVKDVQLLQPLFEFSGACAGCGETPYLKLLSQLFGDRTIIAN